MNRSAAVECLLFVAGEPITVAEIARALECDGITVETALQDLRLRLAASESGLQVIEIAGGYQLSTQPEYSESIARLVARGPNKLSRAALETAAIIAYRQPITQPEIEAVRGVGCGSVLETLTARGLVHEVGRKQTLGRPILYSTTQDFLHYFGLADLGELPPLDEVDPDEDLFSHAQVDLETSQSPQDDANLPSADPDCAAR